MKVIYNLSIIHGPQFMSLDQMYTNEWIINAGFPTVGLLVISRPLYYAYKILFRFSILTCILLQQMPQQWFCYCNFNA